MKHVIAVAGATGNLGQRIVRALVARDARVHALVRDHADGEALDALRSAGATVVVMSGATVTPRDVDGAACIVSALAGLRTEIVDAQSALLDAAVQAGVPRLIPSDFSADFTRLAPGENRNFDLRRDFHARLDVAAIRPTSILNGMFADMLPTPSSPVFDFAAKRVKYWGSPDQPYDFTTMDDTAAFTAAAALDDAAPRVLRIAGDQVTAREMVAAASEVAGEPFALSSLGSIEELERKIVEARERDPEAETNVYAPFQMLQYAHDMATGRARLDPLDNDRYGARSWTTVRSLLARRPAAPS